MIRIFIRFKPLLTRVVIIFIRFLIDHCNKIKNKYTMLEHV